MDPQIGQCELPLDSSWQDPGAYVESLLSFVTTSTIFQNLCGGVHVLDFLTRTPDLYGSVLPRDWRDWFDTIDVHDLLNVLLRERTEDLLMGTELHGADGQVLPQAPQSLREYIYRIRIRCLIRSFAPPYLGKSDGNRSTGAQSNEQAPMARHVAVGMKPKKIHEVSNFASFVSGLASQVHSSEEHQSRKTGPNEHSSPLNLVDFGSGQNYLGRTLASPPYNQHVIAIERKDHNVDGARGLDVHAKLAQKEKIMRNKKEYKRRLAEMAVDTTNGIPTPPLSDFDLDPEVAVPPVALSRLSGEPTSPTVDSADAPEGHVNKGSMTHINHEITSGELESIVYPAKFSSPERRAPLMTISLHSCGNLTHHALRSIQNPSVRCVAAIGCCYNLLTERLGPATYKHPQLHRSLHPRLVATSTAYDPCGFPMSRRLEEYSWTPSQADGPATSSRQDASADGTLQQCATGVRMNITARMMAVQAPGNWGKDDSEMFFTRHFYRALLQKILLDCAVVKQSAPQAVRETSRDGNSLSGQDENGTPLIVGSLKKSAFDSFEAYVQAAVGKLAAMEEEYAAAAAARNKTAIPANVTEQPSIRDRTSHLTRQVIQGYEAEFGHRRKHLAIMWSLMAFSAGVVESLIAVDRWLWLKEQDCVESAWVQTVFDYAVSPRNLCVVGVKKTSC